MLFKSETGFTHTPTGQLLTNAICYTFVAVEIWLGESNLPLIPLPCLLSDTIFFHLTELLVNLIKA